MKLSPRTIRQQVTEQIRDLVIEGKFEPGQPLREVEFARELGVSRGPVRDAFLQLAQEGLLAYHTNRGVTVNDPPDPANRAFIVSLRQQIECHVARSGLEDLGEEGLGRIEESLEQLRAACQTGDAVAVAQADVRFHETLVRELGGESFLTIWRWLCTQMLMAYTRLENYDDVYREHVEIFEAVRSGQQSRVERALEHNIQ